ncbi:MAG: HIT domain-containing protein [Spongiibacteraceae bacterium]|jgi:diadenosine tetraphosphate (Ap4A) HIT family hydrolase|nr:HIT domain-containing protein [Spongiibacteraceae bacterium]
MFVLHSQLAKDCTVIGDLSLCRVLLMNDARFPWLILVPQREEITEVFELSALDQRLLWEEVSAVAAALAGHTRAHKMNIATLGNVVPQLHVHVIARRHQDAAWPAPVWGAGAPEPYDEAALTTVVEALTDLLVTQGLQRA